MQTFIRLLRDMVATISDVFAVGAAFDSGQLTPGQTSAALQRVAHRSDVRQFEFGEWTQLSAEVRRDAELVDAR